MDSSSLSHIRYKCQYHIVFIPKYRKRIMYGRLKADVREIIKKLCDYRNIEIVEGAVCADHVHLCLSIPPSEKVSDVVGYIKGKSALMIHDKYPESVNGWSKAFWARVLCCNSRQYHRRCCKRIHSATKRRIEKRRY